MNDLRRALEEMAETGSEAAGAAPVADVLGRRRRRRIARRSAATVGSVAAATALVVTGASLIERHEPPAPPATEEPTPGPTPDGVEPTPGPEPTPDAVVLPEGDLSLPWGVCGSVVGAGTTEARSEGVTASAGVDVDAPAVGTAVPWWAIHGHVTPAQPADGDPVPPDTHLGMALDGAGVVVTADDVVVAIARFDEGAGGHMLYLDSVMHSRATVFEVCAPEGQDGVSVGEPLPAGDYELRTVTRVWDPLGTEELYLEMVGDTEVPLDFLEGRADAEVATSAPVALTYAEGPPAPPPATVPARLRTAGPEPVCGEQLQPWDDGGYTPLVHDMAPLTVSAGEGVDLRVTLEYRGDGTIAAGHQATYRGFVVTDADGRVVGSGDLWGTDAGFRAVHLGRGGRIELAPEPFVPRACEPGEDFSQFTEPLGPGTYRLHATHRGYSGSHVTNTEGDVVARAPEVAPYVTIVGLGVELTIE